MEKIILVEAERRKCASCNLETWHRAIKCQAGPHFGRLVCNICDSHWGFIKKPENQGKRDKNRHTPASLEIGHCQLCLRARQELINTETLESHHIIEIKDGGPDEPENIWVLCTPCHRIVHFMRTYLRRNSGNYGD